MITFRTGFGVSALELLIIIISLQPLSFLANNIFHSVKSIDSCVVNKFDTMLDNAIPGNPNATLLQPCRHPVSLCSSYPHEFCLATTCLLRRDDREESRIKDRETVHVVRVPLVNVSLTRILSTDPHTKKHAVSGSFSF